MKFHNAFQKAFVSSLLIALMWLSLPLMVQAAGPDATTTPTPESTETVVVETTETITVTTTPVVTSEATVELTPTVTITATPIITEAATATPTATITATPVVTEEVSLETVEEPTVEATPEVTATPSPEVTEEATPEVTATLSPEVTEEATSEATETPVVESTPAPLAMISGSVVYQSRIDQTGITVMPVGFSNKLWQTDNSSQFELIDLADGEYQIQADANLYLPSCTTISIINGQSVILNPGILVGGDTDDSNDIKINDVTLIGNNFGLEAGNPAMDPRADINADGLVNIKDLVLVSGNFGKQGCQVWNFENTVNGVPTVSPES